MIFRLLLILIFTAELLQAEQYFYLSKKKDNVIEQYSLNSAGDLKLIDQLKLSGGPGGLSLSRDRRKMYFSVSTESSSELGTAKIGPKGKLSFLGKAKIESGGSGTISNCGHYYFKYNYGKNTVSVLEMKNHLHTGKQIQEIKTTKNPHDIGVSNDGKLVFVPHNAHNRLFQFKFDKQSGKLEALKPPYLEGPNFEQKGFAAFRSLAFHPIQNVVYCTYERGGGIASLTYDSNGLKLWQEFSTTEKGKRVLPTVVALCPNNKFLYVPNRHGKEGGSSIAAFKLDPETGEILNRIRIYNYSATGPRSMAIDKTGKFLFTSSVRTDSTFQFRINDDGSLRLMKEHKIGSGSMLILNSVK